MTKQDRQNWAGVAILSVVLHALLFAYHATVPANLSLQSAEFSGTILICSGGQAQAAWLGQDGEDDGSTSGRVIVKCPICSAVGSCMALPGCTGEFTTIVQVEQPFGPPFSGRSYHGRVVYSHAARAPPRIV